MSFIIAVKDFLRYCAVERRLSEHTLQAYRFDLQDFGRWFSKPIQLAEVRQTDLEKYLEDMVSTRTLSPATVRRRFACLRSFFRRLGEKGNAADPFGNWHPKVVRRKRLPKALVKAEVNTLLKSLSMKTQIDKKHDHKLQIALRLMLTTGLRVGELCALKRDDISPDCAVIRVHGKGSRERVVFITDSAFRTVLKRLVRKRYKCSSDDGALFLNRRGSVVKPQSFRQKLRRYAADVGIQRRITPHMLRHTAATLLIETGVDIRFVQRLLGHSSIATTEIYTHVADEALRSALERANVLGSLGLT